MNQNSTKFNYHARTLLERGDGFFLSSPPPFDVLDDACLNSHDSWGAISFVLENVKRGRFNTVSELIGIMQRDTSADIWDACGTLLSFAAPYSILRSFLETFHRQIYEEKQLHVLRYSCGILSRSMGFWAVPIMIKLYTLLQSDIKKQEVEGLLSEVLEETPSQVDAGPVIETKITGLRPLEEVETIRRDQDYVNMLIESTNALETSCQLSPSTPINEGKVFSLRSMAKDLLVKLNSGEDSQRIERGRMLLEGTTGLDCRSFYSTEYRLQPLSAAAVVEEFLESLDADKYEPGVRYFFGHRIPD